MGNKSSTHTQPIVVSPPLQYKTDVTSSNEKDTTEKSYFLMERIIDTNPMISVGVFVRFNGVSGHRHFTSYQHKVQPTIVDPINPTYSHQGIRIGENDHIYELITFKEQAGSIHYEFKGDNHLFITKQASFIETIKEPQPVFYTLKTPSMNVTKEVPKNLREQFKPISIKSNELDAMYTFVKV